MSVDHDPRALGFAATVEQTLRDLTAVRDGLSRVDARGEGSLERPFVLDSTSACISTYGEALALVRTRFWTTTSLSSGFWTRRVAPIARANAALSRRLGGAGQMRRLFLLDGPPERVVEDYRERRVLLDRMGKRAELERFDGEIQALERNVAALTADGCAIRVVFDSERTHEALPAEMGWRPEDSELAIYDRFRVDVFAGASVGRIDRVTGFSRAMKRFEEYLAAAETFFAELWQRSRAIDGFLEHLEGAIAASRKKVHYRANWLARYELARDDDDARLKAAEAARVEEVLRQRRLWGAIRSYLDVGTCTGRYLVHLRGAVRAGGVLVGVDDDPECIQFARSRVAGVAAGARVDLVCADFGARTLSLPQAPFHIVTCMMSTLSHFGPGRLDDHDDAFQAALVRLRQLLAPDGLLLFTTWSREACAARRLLSIYDDDERRRLAAWTPDRDEIAARLSAAGFTAVERSEPDPRLDLWVAAGEAAP